MKKWLMAILAAALLALAGTALADTFPASVIGIAPDGSDEIFAIDDRGRCIWSDGEEWQVRWEIPYDNVMHLEVDRSGNVYWLTRTGLLGMNDGREEVNSWLYDADDAVQISVSEQMADGNIGYDAVVAVLHEDGRVSAARTAEVWETPWYNAVYSWQGVKQIANCLYGIIGLKTDGTVCFAPAPGWEAYAPVLAGWQGITGLRSDDYGILVAGYRADGSCVSTAALYGEWLSTTPDEGFAPGFLAIDAQLNQLPPITSAIWLDAALVVSTEDRVMHCIPLVEDEEYLQSIHLLWGLGETDVLQMAGNEFISIVLYTDEVARSIFGWEEKKDIRGGFCIDATYEWEMRYPEAQPLSLTPEDVVTGAVDFKSGDPLCSFVCVLEGGSVFYGGQYEEKALYNQHAVAVENAVGGFYILKEDGSVVHYNTQRQSKQDVRGSSDVVSVAYSRRLKMLLCATNTNGVLGAVDNATPWLQDCDAVMVASSNDVPALFLMKDGTVQMMDRRSNITLLDGWTDVVNIACGRDGYAAVRADGTVLTGSGLDTTAITDAVAVEVMWHPEWNECVAVLHSNGAVSICTGEGRIDTGLQGVVGIFSDELRGEGLIALQQDGSLVPYCFPGGECEDIMLELAPIIYSVPTVHTGK